MVDRWIHILDSGGNWWIQPIWSAINKSVKRKKVARPDDEIHSLGLHVSTRLNMLPRINKRVDEELKTLFTIMKNHETKHVTTLQKRGVAYQIDNELKHHLLIDIDSLLFETNSCTELIQDFLVRIYQHLNLTIESHSRISYLQEVEAAMKICRADLIGISAGFDNHAADWGGLLTTEDYKEIGRLVRWVANRNEGGCFGILEGGYNHTVLGENVLALIQGMEDES